jgi:integrase
VLDDELRKARLGPLYQPEVTLRQLGDVFLEQYGAAPSSRERLAQQLAKATARFGDEPIGSLDALAVARCRASLPETTRHGAHRALRQVLAAAVRWRWIERNVAVEVKNPLHPRAEFTPFGSWEEVDALARELGPFGALAISASAPASDPRRPSAPDWTDVDLEAGVFTVRRAFAKGRLKTYPNTERSRGRVPLRSKVVVALEELARREGILFPASEGGRIAINNFRSREWAPALKAAGIEHRRIYDMRHTFATWSLAAGMGIFTLARRMGTSVKMIDATYGHLAQDAEDQGRGLLDAYDAANNASGHAVGTMSADMDAGEESAA